MPLVFEAASLLSRLEKINSAVIFMFITVSKLIVLA